MDLDKFTVEQLIECLPENAPLYKDSGLWQILDDDTNEPVAYQHANENLKQFLIRHIEHLMAFGNESLEVDLAVAKQLHTSDEPKLYLFNVSGMFSSDKLEQAYKDGVRDALVKGYGTFDEENYG